MEVKQPPAKLLESEEKQEKVVKLLEKRLEKHNDNRKVVQGKLTEIPNKLRARVDELEERISRRLGEEFASEEDRLQTTLNELCENSTTSALQKAKTELHTIQSYEIIENEESNNDITTLYELKIKRRTIPEDASVGLAISEVNSSAHDPSNTTEKGETPCDSAESTEERERLIELLDERLEEHDNNKKGAQDKLHEICEKLRAQIVELEDRVNKELEEKFASEDNRLQAALNELRGNSTISALQKAKAELLVEQSYEILENSFDSKHDLTTMYELKMERRIVPELMGMRKTTNVHVAGVNRGRVSVEFTCLNPDEDRVLSDKDIVNPVKYKCMFFKKCNEQEGKEYPLDKNEDNSFSSSFTFTPDILEAETTYGTRAKMVVGDREYEWSDEVAEFTTPEFKEWCVWKECPDDVDDDMKYSVDEGNPRVATKINSNGYCTIIGNTYIPFNKVTSWGVKILESRDNNGEYIYIGVAPNDINQNVDVNYNKCGWYFFCYFSWLCSGPPHNYSYMHYGPRKEEWGQYVHTGDSVGVVVDTTKGNLSFVLNGVNLGAGYGGIPLDKPLVPCVILGRQGDSVELDLSEMKEDVDSSVPVPSNITAKSTAWDSITLTWDEVADASFYQIEVDRSISCDIITTNTFTKRGFFPETELSFRVRAVRGSSGSKWCSVVKGKTLKAPEFSKCVWKECPGDVDDDMKYSVDEGIPRVATKVTSGTRDGSCTIIGNTPIPLSKVTSWGVKILESRNNDGGEIWIGIAPNDINQNGYVIYDKCGWYFDCYSSTLHSGPPHNYSNKDYGPRKEKGQYVHTGDSVGVVMDTTKGNLSFILNGVNRGAAYCGIPLDKPLVPCVILGRQGDSVEIDTSEVKVNVDSPVFVPSNITAKSTAWDSITLTWDEVADASFYQIEVDGSKSGDATTTNTFSKRGLFPETEYSFRVRAVRGSSGSKWCSVVKGKTLKAPEFSKCMWKECPGDVDDDMKYSVDEGNPRVATKINNGGDCTIIGNTHIPLNKVTSWNIKVHKSRENNGRCIWIGIAPFDINQNVVNNNCNTCGWYYDCFVSKLDSGPPHNYRGEHYGPVMIRGGLYVHTGDSVGVVVDTTRGDLSFVLNGTNYGAAYGGIPLDKPLVPCVLLIYPGDSVELII